MLVSGLLCLTLAIHANLPLESGNFMRCEASDLDTSNLLEFLGNNVVNIAEGPRAMYDSWHLVYSRITRDLPHRNTMARLRRLL
jgi:hypothetical protein